MDAKVIQFPTARSQQRGWVCGCGAQQWILYEDGSVYCPECECISAVIKVIKQRPAADEIEQPEWIEYGQPAANPLILLPFGAPITVCNLQRARPRVFARVTVK